jgi:hypothetical protein
MAGFPSGCSVRRQCHKVYYIWLALLLLRNGSAYEAANILSEERSYPAWKLCNILHLTRSAYHQWLKQVKGPHEQENERIAEKVKEIHAAHPDMGYHMIRDELDKYHGKFVQLRRYIRLTVIQKALEDNS